MKEKTSFILHHDTLSVIEDLTDEQVGQLIREIYKISVSLNNPDNPVAPSGLKGLMNSVLHPFKAQLLRDYDKYVGICERNKANGALGGRPEEPTGPQSTPSEPDSDSLSHSQKEKGSDTLEKTHHDYMIEIYVSLNAEDLQDIMPFFKKCPDVEKFGELTKKIYSETEVKFRGKPLWLCRKVFDEYSKPEEPVYENTYNF